MFNYNKFGVYPITRQSAMSIKVKNIGYVFEFGECTEE